MRNRRAFITILAVGPGDTTAPTCTLTSSALQLVKANFTITATLSEVSTDFTADSLTLVNCSVSIAGSGTSYTITVTPTADGTVSVLAKVGGFHDAAGNANTDASNTISRIYLASLGIWVKSDSGTWKDAAKSVAATADDDLIYAWANLVTGNDFIQATADNQPKLKIVAGAHFVRFDGSNDFMSALISADASCTLFFVAKKLTAPGVASDVFASVSGNGNATILAKSTLSTGFNYWVSQGGTNVALGGTPTNLSVVSLVYTDAANASARIDGGTATTFDPNDVYASGTVVTIGGQSAAGNPGDADFLEVIYCAAPLADGPRAAVEAYLATRIANPT